MARSLIRVAVKDRKLRRKLIWMRNWGFLQARQRTVDTMIDILPGEMEKAIKRGKFSVPALRPRTIARKTAKGAPRPEVPLFDTGGYAESWTATKRVRRRGKGVEVSALMDPVGNNARGIPYWAIARIMEYGFSGQIPRPHVQQFVPIAQRLVKRVLKQEVLRVLRR